MQNKHSIHTERIVIFDGVCNLCSASVKFIEAHTPKNTFTFESLQTKRGSALAQQHGIHGLEDDTFVFIDGAHAYTRSEAALKLSQYLDPPWRYASCLRVFPLSFRDAVYRLIARNRYRLFGKQDTCELK